MSDFAQKAHQLHPTIVREYDIRGIVGETLSESDAYAIGCAYGTMMRRAGGLKAAVGFDGRLTSPALAQALSEGIASTGVDVVQVGRGPTPMLYFAAYTLDVDGGIMVTGSHNPPTHNGFKIVLQKKAFFGERIRELAALAAAGDFEQGRGQISSHPMEDTYLGRMLEEVRFSDPDMKVVWDAGNGATGDVLSRLVRELPGQHETLFAEVDGSFPNHHPDPTVAKNLVDLQKRLAEVGAQVGVAFDGDGDRIGLIDEEGEILWGDQIMLLLALDILKERPGATFIADVKASQVLFDEIERAGGKAVMWKTGHSHIKNKMVELQAPFAGEMSAHLFFADRYYGYDDALYAAIRVLNIVAQTGQSLADFRKSLPRAVNTPEMRFDISEDRKFAVVDEVAARLKDEGANVCDVDGVRVSTEDGWWLLRASNTQAVLVARCEAKDTAGLERLRSILASQLEKSGVQLPE
ncbi:phosphoglucomutase/phosphomannomutase PgmG [Kiloniella sp. b19]|uniref:phosphoglucomutase/phosphomannomutase PgmG n=1 Tax=Kiloniella sp. GXU_MW_B19 TaxID=3141326 RepID=UPI0031E0AF9B